MVIDFIKTIKDILDEQGKTTQDLFNSKIISEDTFYKYKQRYPSLKTLINIVNYLGVSIDYLLGRSVENDYTYYTLNSVVFYNNLISLIKSRNISGRRFCSDLHYSRDNLIRWKNGTQPSVQSLIEIAKYFNCTIDDLLK